MQIYLNNSNVMRLTGLRNVRTGDVIADADVELTLLDPDGDEVAGQTWPVTLAPEGGGTYFVVLPPSLNIDRGTSYDAVVTATGGGATGEWHCSLFATRRNCS